MHTGAGELLRASTNLAASFTLMLVLDRNMRKGRPMRKNLQKGGWLLMLLLLAGQQASWSQKGTTPAVDRERERRSFAQNFARALNAAEADYFKKHGVYANWETLVSLGDFSSSGTKWASSDFPTVAHALYGSGPEIVPGWRLRLHLSNGDKAYDAVIEDVTDLKCGYAVITDERGMIRQGKSVECAP